MPDVRKDLADLICLGDEILNPQKWLAEEAADLARRIPNLDEIPSQAIRPLVRLVATGVSDRTKLAQALDMDEADLAEYLRALCDCDFVEATSEGYRATPTGEQAFEALGRKMIDRELFQLKARLDHVERLSTRFVRNPI